MSVDKLIAHFRAVLAEDRRKGKLRSREGYQRIFAGFEEAIGEEYDRAVGSSEAGRAHRTPDVDATAAAPPSADGSATSSLDAALDRLRAQAPESYPVETEVARGGMGVILKVRDSALRRDLAMKVVRGETEDPDRARELLRRFVDEAQITAQLDHPGVVPIHRLGIDRDGRVFFTMKLVEGRTLLEILALVRERREGWSLTRAVQLLLRICDTLAFAHAKGVVHRDLKPANVMVGAFGEVYVMDWGLAKVLGRPDAHHESAGESVILTDAAGAPREAGSAGLTAHGQIVGTPTYMSPEQAVHGGTAASARSDVYAMGAILYETLAGVPPYAEPGRSPSAWETLQALRTGPPRPLRELAPQAAEDLRAIAEKAMARDPAARYDSARTLSADLQRWLEGRVVHAHRRGPLVELVKWVRRNRGAAASLAVAVLALVGGVVAYGITRQQAASEIGRQRDDAVRARADAESARDAARAAALVAEGQRLCANSLLFLEVDPATALWLALRGAQKAPGPQARHAVWSALHEYWPVRVLEGHDRYAVQAVFSPDGRLLATREMGPLVLLRDGETGELLYRLEDHRGVVTWLAWSPDGRQLATSSLDGEVRLWAAASGVCERTIAHPAEVTSVVWSPDGQTLATACLDGEARLFDAATGEARGTLARHEGGVRVVQFDPTGDRVLSCGFGGDAPTARLTTVAERREIWSRQVPMRWARFTPGGRYCVTADFGRTAHVLDADTGEPVPAFETLAPEKVSFSPDESQAIVYADDGCRRWDVVAGTLDASVGAVAGWWAQNCGDYDWMLGAPAWAPDGTSVVVLRGLSFVVIDPRTLRDKAVLRGHRFGPEDAAFSPDGRRVATAAADRSVRLWQMERPWELRGLQRAGTAYLYGVVGGDRWLVVGPALASWLDKRPLDPALPPLELRDARTGDVVRVITQERYGQRVSMAPKAHHLAVRERDAIVVRDLITGAEASRWQCDPASDWDAGPLSEDLRSLVVLRGEGYLPGERLLIDLATGESLPVEFDGVGVNCAAVASGVPWLAIAHDAAWTGLTAINPRTGVRRALRGHTGTLLNAAFSPDGKLLATTAVDSSFAIWDPATGRRVAQVSGLPINETAVEWSPDGLLLRSGIYLYETKGWTPFATIPSEFRHVLGFTDDSRSIVLLRDDRTIVVLPLDPLPLAESLDPPLPPISDLRRVEYGTPEERDALARDALAANPSVFTHLRAALGRARAGSYEDALVAVQRAEELAPSRDEAPYARAQVHAMRAADEAQDTESRRAHADAAFVALTIAVQRGSSRASLEQERDFAPLRDDPRWKALLERAAKD